MNLGTTIGVGIALFVASIAALWPVLTLGPGIRDRLEGRVLEARITLGAQAKETLREMRAQLEEVFAASDDGTDPYLLNVDPDAVSATAREYTKLVQTSAGLLTAMNAIQRRTRLAFVVLVVFVVSAFGTVLTAALGVFIGLLWAFIGLALCGAVFLVGAVAFVRIAMPYRRVDAGVGMATTIRLERGETTAGGAS